MSKKTRALSIVVCISLVAGMMTGCKATAPQEEAATEVMVSTQSPTTGSIALSTEFTGRIEPNESVMVMPKSAGEVQAVNFKVGDTVRKGDVLFQMDPTYIQLQVDSAQAGYDLAVAQTTQALGSSMDQALLQAQSAYEQARLGFKTARDTFDDYDDNFNDSLRGLKAQVEMMEQARDGAKAAYEAIADNPDSSSQDILKASEAYNKAEDAYQAIYQSYRNLDDNDDANVKQMETGKDNAKIGLDTTSELLALIEGKSREEAEAIVAAQLNQVATQIKSATKQLEDTRVTSPIDGVIEMVDITENNTASTSTQAFLVSNKSLMTVKFSVSSDAVKNMEVGDKVTVQSGRKTYNGSVTEISTMVSAESGLFQIKASVENAEDLYTGVTVIVNADTQKTDNAMVIPLDAVYYDLGKPYVYVVDNGVAVKTFIETGIDDNENVEVLSGLSPSSRVVTTWDANLIDGAKVTDAAAAKPVSANPTPVDAKAEAEAEAATQPKPEPDAA